MSTIVAVGAPPRAKWGRTMITPPGVIVVGELPSTLPSGLIVWLDAADGATLFQDAARTVPSRWGSWGIRIPVRRSEGTLTARTVPATHNGAVRAWLFA